MHIYIKAPGKCTASDPSLFTAPWTPFVYDVREQPTGYIGCCMRRATGNQIFHESDLLEPGKWDAAGSQMREKKGEYRFAQARTGAHL